MKIRRATPQDAYAITSLLRELEWFDQLHGVPLETAHGQVRRHLESCLADESHSVYVAEDDTGRTVGYVSVHWLPYLFLQGPEGYISELFLRRSARGQGAGTALLEAIEAEARERGCVRLALVNGKERESYRRGFYAKRGWREREDVANFVYLLGEKEHDR
jgi:GNAT superfamily N-acetyltransferase